MKKLIFLFLFTIFSSTLHAYEWKLVENADSTFRVYNIKCLDNICYAVAQRDEGPSVLKSYDYGRTWEETFFEDMWYKQWWDVVAPEFMEVADTNHLFIRFRDEGSEILKSSDGGYSFKKIKIDPDKNEWIKALKMFDKDRGYIATYSHTYFTYDGWETNEILREGWPLRNTNQFFEHQIKDNESIYSIISAEFVEFNFSTQEFIRYMDLYNLTIDRSGTVVSDIEIINDTLGFAVGRRSTGVGDTDSDLMFRTKGKLADWELQFDSIPDPEHPWGLQEVSFYDEFNGFAAGDNGRIYLTKDGGNTWVVFSMQEQLEELGNLYNPSTALCWADTIPILGAFYGLIFRYEGDFFDFTQTPRLYHPTTSEPQCGSDFAQSPQSLSWNPSADAQYYRIELDTSYKYKTPLVIIDSITSSQADLSILPCGSEYFWRVRSYNEELKSRWSDNCTFSIKEYKPTLTFPEDNADIKENYSDFKWESSPDLPEVYEELYYQIQFSKSEDFDSIVVNIDKIKSNEVEVEGLDWTTTYFWRVRGYNDKVYNNWSDIRSFKTGPNGIEGMEEEFQLIVTPNPATNYITIESNLLLGDVDVYDMLGNLVLKARIGEKIDVSTLPRGAYIIYNEKNHLFSEILLLF